MPATTGSPERGRELIERFGGIAAALRATHPDTREPGYTDTDFASVQAVRASARAELEPAKRTSIAPAPAFVVWPADMPLPSDAPGCAVNLDDALELTRGMTGDLRVTPPDEAPFVARLVDIVATRGIWGRPRLVFDRGGPVEFEYANVKDAAYINRDGRGELRVGFVDGTGLVVEPDDAPDVGDAVEAAIIEGMIRAATRRKLAA